MTMRFRHGHAAHRDWQQALQECARQIDSAAAQDGGEAPTLGFAYFSDHYAPHAAALLQGLRERWPGVAWTGTAGVGIAGGDAEYIDEPALALMVAALPHDGFRVFSGTQPLGGDRGGNGFDPWTALVHADAATPDLGELVGELSERVDSGYLFGGLASSRAGGAQQLADALVSGGLSGVAFGPSVGLVSRVTQGCQPIGPVRQVTAAERNIVLELDGRPALPLLLQDLGVGLDEPRAALPKLRATLVGLSDGDAAMVDRPGQFGRDTRVRHLIGLDPGRGAVAVAERVEPGMQLAFCHRDVQAARRDLVRICAEIREELEPPRMAGALYVSCVGRGGAHFGGPSAELQIVRHALGELPLVGFFAGGEIARRHLYGYTGVLTVFTTPG